MIVDLTFAIPGVLPFPLKTPLPPAPEKLAVTVLLVRFKVPELAIPPPTPKIPLVHLRGRSTQLRSDRPLIESRSHRWKRRSRCRWYRRATPPSAETKRNVSLSLPSPTAISCRPSTAPVEHRCC